MAIMKMRWQIFAVAALIFACVLGWRAYSGFNTSRSSVADPHVRLADYHSADPAAVRRGQYVMRLGDCAACHDSKSGELAGGYTFDTKFGTLLSSNITPDIATGIGRMTERDFFNAMRHGRGTKGLLYPAMPYTAYAKLTDQDVHDLWAYMSTVRPVSNAIDENGAMHFPYNLRIAMAGWDFLFFDNRGLAKVEGLTPEQTRGKYLVDGAAHCSACHSPRNALGAEKHSADLQGGSLGTWYAPDITANLETGIGALSQADIATYLKTGQAGGAVAAGPMAEAVEHSLQYASDSDLRAIASYLQTVPPSSGQSGAPARLTDDARTHGALDYEVNCSACHGLKGEGLDGIAPAFAGNHGLLGDDATNLIHAMLKGTRGAATSSRPTAAGMPAFAWKMDDAQIADILNYVRNSWGNGAAPVQASSVAEMRATLKARAKLPVPRQSQGH